MLDLGFVLLLSLWSLGVGLRVVDRFGLLPEHPADASALAIPIGLGALALATLGLGELGVLDATGLMIVLALGSILGAKDAWRGVTRLGRALSNITARPTPPDLVLLPILGVAVVGTLLTALAPVTDGDALCYHLQVPKVFLERGAVFFDPDLHETVYPLLTEMLYAVALAFRGPVACRLVQWVLGLCFAAGVTALARPSLGDRAWWAVAFAMLVPAVSNGMAAPLNDVALAAFGTAALVAWSRFRDRPGAPAAALAGILAGLAMGVKYPALVLTGLIGLAIALRGAWPELPNFKFEISNLKFQTMRNLRLVLVFAAAAAPVGGCWYARAWAGTGNPVYPFFRHTFGGSGLDEVLDPIKRPMPVDAWNLLTALGPMTLRPDRFDSLSHQFGPTFLLFLPALLLERPPRRVLSIAALGYAFLTICLTQRQSMRFVLIAVGPMSVAVAWLISTWWDRRSLPSRLLVGACLLILAAESGLAAARARHGLGVVLGRESAEHYLARREPTFRVGRWIDQNLPRGARLVGQDHRGFYVPRAYTMELAHRRRTGLGRHGETAEAVVDHLREAGFTHLLLCPPEPETAVEFDPTLSRLLAPWLDGRAPAYREDLADADGVVRRYAIFQLDDAVAGRDDGRARR
jgi:hypothetical protein